MRLFSLFLPQFHPIPENDEWWGKGFTEWVNVKAATPLFQGHRILHPYGDNYYNLLNKKIMEWHTSLLKQYHIDGMIYYHYYFKGKLLLEKPAENLLKWKDIDQPFFFCWANHPWKRSWEGKQDIIMPLDYGNESDWEIHFQYLLPFFRDVRYEKKDNMPLFMIFKSDFVEKNDMFSYFDKRCQEEGFDGLCLIETFQKLQANYRAHKTYTKKQYFYFRQPDVQKNEYVMNIGIFNRILRKIKRIIKYKGIPVYNGDILMERLITSCPQGDNIINGLWFEWDNTYRHKKRGYIIAPYSKDLFFKYMNLNKDNEYMFINAWNEWCEGMTLEPTKEYGYKYLEWIKEWKESF